MIALAILYTVFVNKLGILLVLIVIPMALGLGNRMRKEPRNHPKIPL